MASDIEPPLQEPSRSSPSKKTPKIQAKGTGDTKPKNPKPRRPNYAQIHARPLPLNVYPLPVFIPHNPLSIVRVAIALISHTLWPPTSHKTVHRAYFSTETHSIHVTDPQSIRALWEDGFWGAGSLSRSEPRWLDQEKRKRGIEAAQTSEEFTRQRREERRQFKLERARMQREAIDQQLREEGKLLAAATIEESATNGELSSVVVGTAGASDRSLDKDTNLPSGDSINVEMTTLLEPAEEEDLKFVEALLDPEDSAVEIEDQEHLQLTLEEAFFLTYSLGALDIYRDKTLLPASYILRLYCAYSTFPITENAELDLYNLYRVRERLGNYTLDTSAVLPITPDNPFLLKYVVYHHFRSLGWVVRPGIKFAADYLLYQRGPVFAHARFAIMILPSYCHPYWSETPERKAETKAKETRDWWWLHRVNRVQTQVHKTLMLVYVEVPPPWDNDFRDTGFQVDIGSVLKRYKVREFSLKRWTPNRNRD